MPHPPCPACGSQLRSTRGRTGESCTGCGEEIQPPPPPPPKPYTPEVVETRAGLVALLLVELRRCPCCKSPMLNSAELRVNRKSNMDSSFNRQLQRAGIQLESRVMTENDAYCCDKCAPTVQFRCQLCNELRPAFDIQESVGDPPEHLCKPCFATAPAKAWEEKLEALQEAHRYDYQ